MKKSFYNCAKNDDLFELSERVSVLAPHQMPPVAALVMATGLLRSSWGVKLGVLIVRLKYKTHKAGAWLRIMHNSNPQMAAEILTALRMHLVYGKDTNPPPGTVSAGGYNQKEINILVKLLNAVDNCL